MTNFPGRSQREELGFFAPGSWGMRLEGDGQQPPGQLAQIEYEHAATAEKIEAARQLFPEAARDDFEVVGTSGRRLRHRESGVDYMVAGDQVLLAKNPRRSGVEFFIVDGWRLLFLRPRGWQGNNEELGVPGKIIGGRLESGPGGSVRVIDTKTGSVVEQVRMR